MHVPYLRDPLPLLARLRPLGNAVLLQSAAPGHRASRFDVLAAGPELRIESRAGVTGIAAGDGPLQPVDSEPFELLARLQTELIRDDPSSAGTRARSGPLPFTGGLIGLLGYDLGRALLRGPQHLRPDHGFPDLVVGRYGWALVTDHQARQSELVLLPGRRCPADVMALIEQAASLPPVLPLMPPGLTAEWDACAHRAACAAIHDYILAGDCYQVNLAVRFAARCHDDPLALHAALLRRHPAPFAGFLETGAGAVLSYSPERLLRIEDGWIEAQPIKGTRPRRTTPDADRREAARLLASAKDRAENLMIVDLLRNDLGRHCRPGSIEVPDLFRLESFRSVHHLVSTIRGELRPGTPPLRALGDAFPGGSITGAPKLRAMEIIEELEGARRGPYCGSLFMADGRGRVDASITIRTLLRTDDRLLCWGGGGIVADSDPAAEWAEIHHKVRALVDGR
jgi:para-aminobenzoate synthetase component 1